MWAFILYFICVDVGGEVDGAEPVKVMERVVLNLHPGVDDLKETSDTVVIEMADKAHRRTGPVQRKIYDSL
ncbi:hypothetical protein QQF64_020388 [Cirrhinus molitorella]|uniref:Uncharacterized protein n=1 Tax=Cirrhinus molitorella TaxID=172907 RepID=A0ABR3L973_9TELE